MGAWGAASDENDDTYDILGIADSRRGSSSKTGETTDEYLADIDEFASTFSREQFKVALNDTGAVGFFLKMSAALPKDNLLYFRNLLQNEVAGAMFPNNSEEREEKVAEEISLIDRALTNEPCPPSIAHRVPGHIIGTRGHSYPGLLM